MKVASPVGWSKIEDYAFLSDTQSGALVSRDGCIGWLCLPRFDSGACFAALLGGPENGTWRLRPQGKIKKRERRYRGETLVLETDLYTSGGAVRYIDFMPPRGTTPDIVRDCRRPRGAGDDPDGIDRQVRLRIDRALGAPAPRWSGSDCGTGWIDSSHADRDPWRRPQDSRRVYRRQGQSRSFCADLYPSRTNRRAAKSIRRTRYETPRIFGATDRSISITRDPGKGRGHAARSSPLKGLTYGPTGGIALPSPLHCRRRSVAFVTGIIGSAGCAMLRSLSFRCSARASTKRPGLARMGLPSTANVDLCTRKTFPWAFNLGKILRWKLTLSYGVGDASVVVVSVVLPSVVAGVMVSIGVDSAGVVAVVVVVVVVSVEVAGVSAVSAGDAAGAAVSVFCSHATRSAALARMQIYFFIGYG